MNRYVKRFVNCFLLILGACLIYLLVAYLTVDDTRIRTRVTLHDFYEEDDIDYLFLGPSHSVHAINAVYMSEKLNANCYNLASSSQYIQNSYFLIKEGIEKKNVKNVFYEVSVSRFMKNKVEEISTYILTDYMKSYPKKLNMIYLNASSDQYIPFLFKARRAVSPLNPPFIGTISSLVKEKRTDAYLNYYDEKKYLGKGQWIDSEGKRLIYSEENVIFDCNTNSIDNYALDEELEEPWEYLTKIVELCRRNDVNLVFYIPAYSEIYLSNFDNYEYFTKKIKDYAVSHNVPVVDLNLVSDEYLPYTITWFFNYDHVSCVKSEQIADFFAAYIQNPEGDYFVDSLEEKYPDRDKIIGIGYETTYITDVGEYIAFKDIVGGIKKVRVDIHCQGYHDIPSDMELRLLDSNNEVIVGEKMNECVTRFEFSPEEAQLSYKVSALDCATKEVIYDAETCFYTE